MYTVLSPQPFTKWHVLPPNDLLPDSITLRGFRSLLCGFLNSCLQQTSIDTRESSMFENGT